MIRYGRRGRQAVLVVWAVAIAAALVGSLAREIWELVR